MTSRTSYLLLIVILVSALILGVYLFYLNSIIQNICKVDKTEDDFLDNTLLEPYLRNISTIATILTTSSFVGLVFLFKCKNIINFPISMYITSAIILFITLSWNTYSIYIISKELSGCKINEQIDQLRNIIIGFGILIVLYFIFLISRYTLKKTMDSLKKNKDLQQANQPIPLNPSNIPIQPRQPIRVNPNFVQT